METNSFLEKIKERKQRELQTKYSQWKDLEYTRECKRLGRIEPPFYFSRALKKPLKPGQWAHVIGEVKRASPSVGVINEYIDPVDMARTYEFGGASAISVLTDCEFNGSVEDLKQVRRNCGMPLLRKDFIYDRLDIYESAVMGADAVLLIASFLDLFKEGELNTVSNIKMLQTIANNLGMDALVEVNTQEDLEKALEADAQVIGINNRNLHTFDVDINTTKRLLPYIPKGKTIVTMSGIESYANMRYLFNRKKKPDAALIGSAFSKSPDPRQTMQDFMFKRTSRLKQGYGFQEQ